MPPDGHETGETGEMEVVKIEELHGHIRAARKESSMTQRELGKRVGVTPQAIGQWEKPVRGGGVLPPLRRIKQIEDILRVDFGKIELMGEDHQQINMNFLKSGGVTDTLLERRVKLIEAILHADETTLALVERIVAHR